MLCQWQFGLTFDAKIIRKSQEKKTKSGKEAKTNSLK